MGGPPCIKIPTRKIRPPAQMENMVNNTTPINPTHGCQAGIPTGDAFLISINIGVKGGTKDNQVANFAVGSIITGMKINIGKKMGNMAGNVKF